MECGGSKTFICEKARKPLKWNITGLRDINIPGLFLPRNVTIESGNDRITSNDSGQTTQEGISNLTISGFTVSDKGGIIKCFNVEDDSIIGMANISICECVCCVHNAV